MLAVRHMGEEVIEHLGKMVFVMLWQAFPLFIGEIAVFFNQVPDALLRLVPVEMNGVIIAILIGTGKFDPFPIAPCLPALRNMATISIFMPQKCGALLGIVSLYEVGINADFAVLEAGAIRQKLVDFIFRDKSGFCGGKAVHRLELCDRLIQIGGLPDQRRQGYSGAVFQQRAVCYIRIGERPQFGEDTAAALRLTQKFLDPQHTFLAPAFPIRFGNGVQVVLLFCRVTEIRTEIGEAVSKTVQLIFPCRVDLLLAGKHTVLQKLGNADGGSGPREMCENSAIGVVSRADMNPFFVKPHGIFHFGNRQALAADPILLLQKRGGVLVVGTFLEECDNALNAVPAVAAAGKDVVHHRVRYTMDGGSVNLRLPLFFRLGLSNGLHLFLHRGEQAEPGQSRRGSVLRLRGHRSGGLFARRFLLLLIYL